MDYPKLRSIYHKQNYEGDSDWSLCGGFRVDVSKREEEISNVLSFQSKN